MDFLGELYILSKAKSMISSLSGMIMLWATGSASSMLQTPIHLKGVPIKVQHDLQLIGLKTLIYKEAKTCHDQQQIIHSYKALASLGPPKTTPPSLSSTKLSTKYSSWSSSSLVLDDLIGTDSGVHILSSSNVNIDDIGKTTSAAENNKCNNKRLSCEDRVHDRRVKQWEKYPPPLPGLARTGNLACRMHWILTRRYEEGKLVLQGQALERHEYFEARRDDGRLILNLVSIENYHETKSRSYRREEELIQFGEGESNINGNCEQSVADFELLADPLSRLDNGMISRDSTSTLKGLNSGNYACGLFMDIHERSNPYSYSGQASSSAPLVRAMTSVIM